MTRVTHDGELRATIHTEPARCRRGPEHCVHYATGGTCCICGLRYHATLDAGDPTLIQPARVFDGDEE